MAGFSEIPAAVAAAAAHEGRVAAQHDVEDDAQAPQVAALVVDGGFLAEGLHNLRGHVLCRAALRRTQQPRVGQPREGKRTSRSSYIPGSLL